MLVIRKDQMDVFEHVDAPHFESRAIRHVKEAFPKHCKFLGDEGVREVVGYGRNRGAIYDFDYQSTVSFFIDLTLLLGREFDVDFQLPWATETLSDKQETDQLHKAGRLHEAAMDYLDRVSGPNNEYIDEAQRRLLAGSIDITPSAAAFETEALSRLQSVWPQKYAYLGDDGARQLLRAGVQTARGYGFESTRAFLLCTGLMYMLGSGFDRDPLFAWAAKVLTDRRADESNRIDRLYSEAIGYLRHWCV